MSGLQSIRRNLAWEDGEVKRQSDADFNRLNEQTDQSDKVSDAKTTDGSTDMAGEDMENLVAGNQTIEHHYHAAAPVTPSASNSTTTNTTNTTQATPVAAVAKGLGAVGKALVAGSLLTGGTGAGVLLNQFLHPATTTTAPANPPSKNSDFITDVAIPGDVSK